jgi:hypothetical protein
MLEDFLRFILIKLHKSECSTKSYPQKGTICANSWSGFTSVARSTSRNGNAANLAREEIARDAPHGQQESRLLSLIAATLQDAWFVRYGMRWTSEKQSHDRAPRLPHKAGNIGIFEHARWIQMLCCCAVLVILRMLVF